MEQPKRPYNNRNIFTFGHERLDGRLVSERLPEIGEPNGYEQFDLGIVEFNDQGDFEHGSQLDAICERIIQVRKKNLSGAIVVCFIHGWHNNAEWNNANLVSFQRLLSALMFRETEFLQRRVIGVYFGWNGQPSEGLKHWLSRIPLIKHTSFKDRYSVAGDIGDGEAVSSSLYHLTNASKDSIDYSGPESPLILIGHSMGAYMLQSAFREFLKDAEDPYFAPTGHETPTVAISNESSSLVKMPDLFLSLNSAAEAEVAKDIINKMVRDDWKKSFAISDATISIAPYNPPILISTTSYGDSATQFIWQAGHFFQKTHTDGHDVELVTHTFAKSNQPASCEPADSMDFGQPWHCLHKDTAATPTPRFRIDLPDHDRTSGEPLTHTAYDLIPKDQTVASPFWLFNTPKEIVADHGDIFNYKAASFTLALIQLSGVLASAGGSGWDANFSEMVLAVDD